MLGLNLEISWLKEHGVFLYYFLKYDLKRCVPVFVVDYLCPSANLYVEVLTC